jgi:hypothetical protein
VLPEETPLEALKRLHAAGITLGQLSDALRQLVDLEVERFAMAGNRPNASYCKLAGNTLIGLTHTLEGVK